MIHRRLAIFLSSLSAIFALSCATVTVEKVTGTSTSVEGWFKKGGTFYTASSSGQWYLLAEPQGNDSAEVCMLDITNPAEMDVALEIPIGRGRPVGFAINKRGEFITAQASRINVYGKNGAVISFRAAVQDSRLSSPIAVDAKELIYVVSLNGLEIFTRDGVSMRTVTLPGIALSVAIAPDQTIWCVTDATESCHLIHLSQYPGCSVLAEYDRVTRNIRGLFPAKTNNYSNWREVAVTQNRVFLTHGTGTDTGQCIFVLSADGSALLNRISSSHRTSMEPMLNAHGLSANGDTLLYFDYDSKMAKWMNRLTQFDHP